MKDIKKIIVSEVKEYNREFLETPENEKYYFHKGLQIYSLLILVFYYAVFNVTVPFATYSYQIPYKWEIDSVKIGEKEEAMYIAKEESALIWISTKLYFKNEVDKKRNIDDPSLKQETADILYLLSLIEERIKNDSFYTTNPEWVFEQERQLGFASTLRDLATLYPLSQSGQKLSKKEWKTLREAYRQYCNLSINRVSDGSVNYVSTNGTVHLNKVLDYSYKDTRTKKDIGLRKNYMQSIHEMTVLTEKGLSLDEVYEKEQYNLTIGYFKGFIYFYKPIGDILEASK